MKYLNGSFRDRFFERGRNGKNNTTIGTRGVHIARDNA